MPIDNTVALLTDITGSGISTGATVPGSPTTGELFLHTPTGRKILLQYDGTNWCPVRAYGSTTLYVNETSGTDSIDKGSGTGTNAFATVQYAVNQVAPVSSGDVIIYITAETYSENVVITGKSFDGDYTLLLSGTLTEEDSATGVTPVVGATSTQGTVTDAAFTSDAYDNFLCYFETDAEYRVIDSQASTTLTMVGLCPSATSQDLTIYSAGTIITTLTLINQKQVEVFGCSFVADSTTPAINITDHSSITLTACFGEPNDSTAYAVVVSDNSYLVTYYCMIEEPSTYSHNASFRYNSHATLYGSKFLIGGGSGTNVSTTYNSTLWVDFGTVIDGGQAAISGSYSATVQFDGGGGYPRVRNATTYGLTINFCSIGKGTGVVVFSGNGTDTYVVAATFGYIA